MYRRVEEDPSDGRRRALLALLLLVPAPTVGVLCGMVIWPDTARGALVYGLSKVWILALPLLWRIGVERAPLSWSPPRRGGLAAGAVSGAALGAIVIAAYFALGPHFIDPALFVRKLRAVGLGEPGRYLAGLVYWVTLNAVVEEYVWRWFCTRQCEALMRRTPAILCSALLFTVHHIVALQVYLGPLGTALCAAGVFTGGALWSALYLRYRSIWPGYVSHAIVDVAVFGIGALLLFGGG